MKSQKYTKLLFLLIGFLIIGLILFAVLFSNMQKKQNNLEEISLTISVAASLTESLTDIKELYVAENPNIEITFNFGSSGSLQQQIEQGADVDLFFSAGKKQMDALQSKGLILNQTRKNILRNSVVLIIPIDSSKNINDFEDLTNDNIDKIALGEPKSVPAGQYAEELFNNLHILDEIKSKAVYGKDVKEVLTWVESGNADAGIVYITDAKMSDKVNVVATASEGETSPILYPSAVIGASKNIDASKNFLSYLTSDEAKTIFEKYGFIFIAE